MRFIVIALVLLTCAGAQQAKPSIRSKDSGVEKRDSQQKTDAVQQDPANNPAPAIGSCVGCFTEQNPNTETKQTEPYNAGKDTLYRIYLWAAIIGVFVALGGIGAIWAQTIATARSAQATERSAEATEKSVKLQEIAHKQWVNLGGWSVEKTISRHRRLNISFKISNPTKVPLTLHAVLMNFGDNPRLDEGHINLLAPENPYIIRTFVDVSYTQMRLFVNSVLVIPIHVRVLFADAFGRHWEQQFGRMLMCNNTGVDAHDTKNSLRDSTHNEPPSHPPADG